MSAGLLQVPKGRGGFKPSGGAVLELLPKRCPNLCLRRNGFMPGSTSSSVAPEGPTATLTLKELYATAFMRPHWNGVWKAEACGVKAPAITMVSPSVLPPSYLLP